MIGVLMRKIFGSANDRYVKSLQKTVAKINALEPEISALSDEKLKNKTPALKQRLADGETLDDILPEAFAVVREASKRTIGLRHFDVQMIGGIVLHRGQIAEMRTGEGKTLVATLAVYLNALTGKGVHVVTVNDYLAKRDTEWMGQIYRFLGMTVGAILHDLSDEERREAYACDITYGTNNEFGFDYLRDNMKFSIEEMVQRPFNFAIVDEVDSILIDEARTPLIISGRAEDSSEKYIQVDALIPKLRPEHYEKDEKQRSVALTESGTLYMEELLHEAGLITGAMYDAVNATIIHYVDQALKAHTLFQRDVDYIVRNGQVVIIDEFTGRMMEGRRYSDGLHQALEAKEHVKIQPENQTLASITFQNYFRLYPKLAGMTGTAMTEAPEFAEIYGLEVIDIPTNKPCVRIDHQDEIYWKEDQKLKAVIELIKECAERQQPVLVGTTSIEKSEQLAERLKKETKLKFNVLNARHHEQEAYIIAQAGMPGAITIATNMAGRGTDIQLGGNLEMRVTQELADVTDEAERNRRIEQIKKEIEEGKEIALKAGGLYVIGTERHESRRIDNQLRGRSGRQGDPGASKFFLCLQDDLLRIFGADRIERFLKPLGGLEEDDVISSPWISKTLQKSQEKVEARNFDIRKNLLKYDNVMNDQRKVIYDQRRELMVADTITETIKDMRDEIITAMTETYTPDDAAVDDWNPSALQEDAARILDLQLPVPSWVNEGIGSEEITRRIQAAADEKMDKKRHDFGDALMNMIEKNITLQILDQVWKEHLQILDYMRHTIVLRAYGQKDPLNEYKREAFYLFSGMIGNMREQVTQFLMHVELAPEAVQAIEESRRRQEVQTTARHDDFGSGFGNSAESQQETDRTLDRSPFRYAKTEEIDPNDPSTWGKVSRNAPCPCGSGKKYKHCHGAIH
ncbi:MAG: preprotein translocase subunit SecA [Alphaproteobacteria bacterium]|nr:preprotein translocase subunit SecA [Alphaproteobacteria bacterium]